MLARVPGQLRKIVLFNLAAAVAMLAATEAATRAFLSYNAPFRERFQFNVEYQPSGFVQHHTVPNQVIYEVDKGEIQYDKIKFRINKYGYRGDDFPVRKTDGEVRIAFLGGSHVFDLSSFDFEDNPGFPHLAERHLREEGKNVRVINAGFPGNDTRYFAARILLDLHRYSPDIVIINSTWNDTKWISRTSETTLLLQAAPKSLRTNPMTAPVNLLDKTLGFSSFYRKSRDFYWQKKLKLDRNRAINEGVIENEAATAKDIDRGLNQFKVNILGTVRIIESIGAAPVLALEERLVSSKNGAAEKRKIQYRMVNVDSHSELVGIFESCDSILKSISRELGVTLIDVNREMEGNLELFVDHVHTTPSGSRLIARRYAEILMPMVKQIEENSPR